MKSKKEKITPPDGAIVASYSFKFTKSISLRIHKLFNGLANSAMQLYGTNSNNPKMELRSVSEFTVLAALGVSSPLTMMEIVRWSNMEKSNASRAIQRLRNRGYIIDQISPDDKRQKLLWFTKKGESIYSSLVPHAQLRSQLIVEDFSAEELELLNKLLSKIEQQLPALNEHAKNAWNIGD